MEAAIAAVICIADALLQSYHLEEGEVVPMFPSPLTATCTKAVRVGVLESLGLQPHSREEVLGSMNRSNSASSDRSTMQLFRTFIMDPAVRTKFVHMQIRSHSTVYCTSVSTCIAAFGWIWLKVHSLQNAVALNGKSGSLQQPALAS